MTLAGVQSPSPALPAAAVLPHWRPRHPVAASVVIAAAALVAAPLVSLVVIAMGGDADIWQHLLAYVLATALLDTVVLLAGMCFGFRILFLLLILSQIGFYNFGVLPHL